MFKVSRSPIREALFALENGGTVTTEPYRGAILKPLSTEEVSDIAELRLALITLAAKAAHRHLSPADFDSPYGLAKQATRSKSAKEHFEHNRHLWDIIFEKTQRPILWEVFRQLDDRMTRYNHCCLSCSQIRRPDRDSERCSSNCIGRAKLMKPSGSSERFIWRLFSRSLIILIPKSLLSPRIKFHAYLVCLEGESETKISLYKVVV
jgi:FCD domain